MPPQNSSAPKAPTANAAPQSAPTATPPVAPPVAPPEAKPEAPKPLLDAKGELTVAGTEALASYLNDAAEGIGRGLRTFLDNKLAPGQATVGSLENAFEAARKAASGKATVGDLAAAGKALEIVVAVLANHTLKDGRELTYARAAAQKARSALAQLTPPEA